jgi:hypothetical protein
MNNLVWACRSCNSSKGDLDVLQWYEKRGEFPPLLLLRRYIKLAYLYITDNNLLETPIDELGDLPYRVASIPHRFPQPGSLRLWVVQLSDEA